MVCPVTNGRWLKSRIDGASCNDQPTNQPTKGLAFLLHAFRPVQGLIVQIFVCTHASSTFGVGQRHGRPYLVFASVCGSLSISQGSRRERHRPRIARVFTAIIGSVTCVLLLMEPCCPLTSGNVQHLQFGSTWSKCWCHAAFPASREYHRIPKQSAVRDTCRQ